MKKDLRKILKKQRRSISDKSISDQRIRNYLMESDIFKNADAILFYAALDDEINIDECIDFALSKGKKAALPVCLDDNGNMKFYYIDSLNDIQTGYFGVREPDTDICREVTDFNNTICIVPGIVYDKNGYRLGYGKGYYDRFLENYSFISVGLCYNELIIDALPIGEYDVPVNYIITQDGLLTI